MAGRRRPGGGRRDRRPRRQRRRADAGRAHAHVPGRHQARDATLRRQRPEVADPQSPVQAIRLSIEDTLYVRSPILDRTGGTRIGTAYSQFTRRTASSPSDWQQRRQRRLGHGAFQLRDGQIAAEGVFRPANATSTVAVRAPTTGRGTLTFTEVPNGSRDTFRLLPDQHATANG
jgi:hypothetical protein